MTVYWVVAVKDGKSRGCSSTRREPVPSKPPGCRRSRFGRKAAIRLVWKAALTSEILHGLLSRSGTWRLFDRGVLRPPPRGIRQEGGPHVGDHGSSVEGG